MTSPPAYRSAAWPVALACLVAVLGSGCAGDYVARTRDLRRAYEGGRYDEAARGFEGQARSGKEVDKLLALMDQGMVLHASGKYEESIQVLAEADKLSQQLDVISVSEEAKVLLSSEREKAYRGEDFEKLMVAVLQALNYEQLGRDEDALVEVRRVNERMLKMIRDEKKPYQQLAIARYLSGVLWEDAGHEDDAFIDYDTANQLAGDLGSLAEPLVRLAKSTGRDEALQALRKQYPIIKPLPLAATEGQLLVIVEAGRVPEKTNGTWHGEAKAELIAIPVFRDRPWTRDLGVSVNGGEPVAPTPVTSLEDVSKIHLNDRVGRMVAKQLAALAVRAGVSVGVGALTKSDALGALTFLALSYGNQPDLRSWLSLPAQFGLARFRLPSGTHQVALTMGGKQATRTVELKPRRVTLLVFRSY
jgi:hypothetical protein